DGGRDGSGGPARARALRPRGVRHRTGGRARMTREYPDYPRVGVGAIVLHEGRVLLVKRGRAPGLGLWSVPGGLVDLGETTVEAARREVEEECGIKVRIGGLVGV